MSPDDPHLYAELEEPQPSRQKSPRQGYSVHTHLPSASPSSPQQQVHAFRLHWYHFSGLEFCRPMKLTTKGTDEGEFCRKLDQCMKGS